MKYGISRYGKYFSAFMVLALGACTMDNGDESPLVEFGTVQSEFTVNATAGHVDIEVLSNQDCRLSFLDETTWAELSTSSIRGDGKFFIDYDDNDGFPRMTRVLVAAEQSGRCDTVLLKQRGGITPTMTLPSSSLIIPGSASGFSDTELQTNIDFSEVEISMSYTSGEGVDWVEGVSYADGRLTVDYLENPSATQPRSASVTLAYDNGWGEIQTTTLYLIQKTSEDELGQEASFEEVRALALMGASVEIEDFLIISGYVVSDKESRNAGENPKTTYTSIDYTMCEKTVYLESLDGRYGFCLETATEADNIFERYDKVQLLLAGATLTGAENPDRYTISGITTSMVVGRETGSPSAIPVKEKYIAELTDDDIYTFVTLKDCEFPIRKGSLTPVHEGYTLGDAKAMMSKYPRLIRDIQGSSMYLYTNTTCPYRRTGKRLPYGSGNISGVVVFEYYQPYIYGDGIDADTHGRIGRYQLRHMAYEDIRFAEEESFSALLTEYRYIKDKAKSTDGYVYWYPTYGNNGRFTHSYQAYEAGCVGATTWNYLGPVGTAKGTEPFRDHIGNENGLGIILEDGTDYMGTSSSVNTDGKGQDGTTNSWKTNYWWNDETNTGESWRVEFSTKDIVTDHLSMQISVQSGRAILNCTPIYWKAEWSLTGDLSKAEDWTYIASYQVPDFPIYATYREWQLPAFKQIDMELPLEMLGHDKVYIRFTPENNIANTLEFGGGFVNGGGSDSGSAMDYFAIRYNK